MKKPSAGSVRQGASFGEIEKQNPIQGILRLQYMFSPLYLICTYSSSETSSIVFCSLSFTLAQHLQGSIEDFFLPFPQDGLVKLLLQIADIRGIVDQLFNPYHIDLGKDPLQSGAASILLQRGNKGKVIDLLPVQLDPRQRGRLVKSIT